MWGLDLLGVDMIWFVLVLLVDYELNVFIFVVCVVVFIGVFLSVCVIGGLFVLLGFFYGSVFDNVCVFMEKVD